MRCCPCFQRLVVAVLDACIKEWSMKEVVLMLNILGLLADQLEQDASEVSKGAGILTESLCGNDGQLLSVHIHDCTYIIPQLSAVFEWVHTQCKERTIGKARDCVRHVSLLGDLSLFPNSLRGCSGD